jgi:hypothetical protein
MILARFIPRGKRSIGSRVLKNAVLQLGMDASDSFVLDNIAIVHLVVQKDWVIVETCLAIQFFEPA